MLVAWHDDDDDDLVYYAQNVWRSGNNILLRFALAKQTITRNIYNNISYLPTPPLEQDMTQGHF